jgi:hypothetical protein
VLAGSLYDDAGDYPDGTSVRNPIATARARWAGPHGAVLFVKLHQFAATDTMARKASARSMFVLVFNSSG